MNILSPFKLFQTCTDVFVLLKTWWDILYNLGKQTVLMHLWQPLSFFPETSVANIPPNIFPCVQLNQEMYTCLKQLEFTILGELSLYVDSFMNSTEIIMCVLRWVVKSLCVLNIPVFLTYQQRMKNRRRHDNYWKITFIFISNKAILYV